MPKAQLMHVNELNEKTSRHGKANNKDHPSRWTLGDKKKIQKHCFTGMTDPFFHFGRVFLLILPKSCKISYFFVCSDQNLKILAEIF